MSASAVNIADINVAALVAQASVPDAEAVADIDFGAALVSLDDLYAPPEPVSYVVDPIIPEGEVTGIAGPGKIGKSQATLQIGIHVALGAQWCGMAVKQMPVVYLSAEDQTVVLRNRMKGYVQWKLSLTGERDKTFNRRSESAKLAKRMQERLRIVNMRGLGWSLTKQNKGRTEVNAEQVAQLAAWIEGQFPNEKALVMFDTVGRFDEGAESNADYKALVAALDMLQKRMGCTVVLIAHTSQQATLEKRLDLTAMRGGLHLGNSVRSMLVMSGHRLGHRDELLEQQGAVPPKDTDLEQDFYKPLDIEGVPRGDRLSVIVHSDSNVGATRRPLWFMRGGFKGAGVLAPVEFMPDLAGRKEERKKATAAKKVEGVRARRGADRAAVLDYIRAHQDDHDNAPESLLTERRLAEGGLFEFSKGRVREALMGLEADTLIEKLAVPDRRPRRKGQLAEVYRVAAQGLEG